MPKATTDFMTRLESGIGEDATREFLEQNCPDVSPPERHSEERSLFLASKDVDDYLRKRRRKYLEELEGYLIRVFGETSMIDSDYQTCSGNFKIHGRPNLSPKVAIWVSKRRLLYASRIADCVCRHLDAGRLRSIPLHDLSSTANQYDYEFMMIPDMSKWTIGRPCVG